MRRYTVAVDGTPFTIDVIETAADRFEVTVGDQTFEATLESDQDLPGAVISPVMPVPEPRAARGVASPRPPGPRHDRRLRAPAPGHRGHARCR